MQVVAPLVVHVRPSGSDVTEYPVTPAPDGEAVHDTPALPLPGEAVTELGALGTDVGLAVTVMMNDSPELSAAPHELPPSVDRSDANETGVGASELGVPDRNFQPVVPPEEPVTTTKYVLLALSAIVEPGAHATVPLSQGFSAWFAMSVASGEAAGTLEPCDDSACTAIVTCELTEDELLSFALRMSTLADARVDGTLPVLKDWASQVLPCAVFHAPSPPSE